MAMGTFTFFDVATLWEADGTGLIVPSNTFNMILTTSTQALTSSTIQVYADFTAELTTTGGYTLGGVALTGASLTRSGGTTTFTFTGPSPDWTASGGGIAGMALLGGLRQRDAQRPRQAGGGILPR